MAAPQARLKVKVGGLVGGVEENSSSAHYDMGSKVCGHLYLSSLLAVARARGIWRSRSRNSTPMTEIFELPPLVT